MNKKSFKVGEKNYYVISPTPSVIQESSVIYSVNLSSCLKKGVQSKSQILKFLTENGVWDASKDLKEKELRKELEKLETTLSKGNTKGARVSIKEGRAIALKLRDLRRELLSLLSERQSYEANSAESLADNARFDYLVASCTFKEDGTKVYQSLQSYLENAQDEVAYSAASNLASMMYQIDEDYSKKLPENAFLSAYKLVNKDMKLVDKEGNLVDREYRKINEEGHYINDKGERVDINGNRLDEDGNYLIEVDYYDDEEVVDNVESVEASEPTEVVESVEAAE